MGECKTYTVRCSKCSNAFDVTEDFMLYASMNLSKYGNVEVTLFVCPRCNDMNIAKVDSEEIEDIRHSINRNAKVFEAYCKNNQVDSARRSLEQLYKKKKRLSCLTDELVNEIYRRFKVKVVNGNYFLECVAQ